MTGTAKKRAELAERLRQRRGEIEQEVLTRVNAIADSSAAADPAYVQGLRGAVEAALDFSIAAVEQPGEREPPIPVALLAQARSAARNGVSLDTVLRRYFGGYSLLSYFLVEEAGKEALLGGAELQQVLARQAGILDRFLRAVSEEHARESEALASSSTQHQARRIERLLAGEIVDTSAIGYEFDGWHLGLIAAGPDAQEALRELARALGLNPLLLKRDEGAVWAWLGARRRPDSSLAKASAEAGWPAEALLAIGEPGEGIAGWRLTHRQAAAALPLARRSPAAVVRYAEVALLASTLQDDLLVTSLRRLYLEPLEAERDGGKALRQTLRAYFAAERNVSSTAMALGVHWQTIKNRLKTVEERVGRPLMSCASALELALALESIDIRDPEPL